LTSPSDAHHTLSSPKRPPLLVAAARTRLRWDRQRGRCGLVLVLSPAACATDLAVARRKSPWLCTDVGVPFIAFGFSSGCILLYICVAFLRVLTKLSGAFSGVTPDATTAPQLLRAARRSSPASAARPNPASSLLNSHITRAHPMRAAVKRAVLSASLRPAASVPCKKMPSESVNDEMTRGQRPLLLPSRRAGRQRHGCRLSAFVPLSSNATAKRVRPHCSEFVKRFEDSFHAA
jgi:hypothetical protein